MLGLTDQDLEKLKEDPMMMMGMGNSMGAPGNQLSKDATKPLDKRNKDDKKKRRLILYWYYTIMELFPPEIVHRQDIKEGIEFLNTYHSNKCKKKIMPKEELNKNLHFKAKLVKLRLEVPQEYYKIDYQKHLEEFSFYIPLPSRPSVDQLFSRYKSEYYQEVPYDQEITESLIRDRKEIDKLVQRMIPDDPLGKFFKFVKELKKDVTIPIITAKSTNYYTPDQYNQVNRQLELVQGKYKVVQRKLRSKLGSMSDEEFKTIIYDTKKKNGKPNFTQIGKKLGYHPTTIKSELMRRGIIS